jgi:hypothetical protein
VDQGIRGIRQTVLFLVQNRREENERIPLWPHPGGEAELLEVDENDAPIRQQRGHYFPIHEQGLLEALQNQNAQDPQRRAAEDIFPRLGVHFTSNFFKNHWRGPENAEIRNRLKGQARNPNLRVEPEIQPNQAAQPGRPVANQP